MACALLLLLACGLLGQCQQEPQTPDWRMTLKTIRNGVHKIDMYLNAALDLLGGEDGLCLYKCSDGSKPLPRYGYKLSPPNGCGSPLFGVHFDIGIPSMTKCCNQHDRCYDTCGNRKNDCDEQFQYCLSKICREVQKTLGISESVQGQIQVDSGPALNTKGGDQNVTETDAFERSQPFDPAAQYKMNHKRRGVALIFNHEQFYWHLTLPDRRGTLADRDNLKRSLTELGFEVRCFDDLKAEEVIRNIYEASMDNHSDADCFVCVFLSHGEDNHVYAYDAKIKVQTMTNMFKGDKCPSLVGKPKIFIIQACRGDQHDDPVIVHDAVDSTVDKSKVNETEVDAAAIYTLPAGADFLMCYSVAEGYYSHRETLNGTWYIQDLCEMIRKYGSSLEFTELLTLVNRKVSLRRVDMCRDMSAIGKKQIPCFASMLTKKLHFTQKSK
ncbi:group XIIA secretory phospholipase A2 isoform X3 [Malaclemys terrapin pileata]|uniref:group XIIA secretory phospholipase A2 isoform X3 n=1 Tax=Malaclemys terrapin pileata TaxID=2991368 RepID=UPI0023A86A4E|nr:group XIIA secretory phospholipase A2 isoform X3 [Malaclemys terrapin pileata]